MKENKRIVWNQQDLAHPGKRYQGQFLDGIITAFLFFVCMYAMRTMGFQSQWSGLFMLGIPFIYFVFSDALPNGQSLGKRVLGICVVSKTTRKPCSVLQSFARNVLTPILGVIDAILILGKSRQRLGDKMANTIVIHCAANNSQSQSMQKTHTTA